MSTNPDNISYQGLTAPSDDLGVAYLVPTQGMLRFVEREPAGETEPSGRKLRILQQYQWCMKDGKFDWYDVPLVAP